jgi:hypothetical protein
VTATSEAITCALDSLANEPRWVAWRLEQRGDNTTKIPYAPYGFGKAKSNDPSTWGDRAAAEIRVKSLINGHAGGGVGLELGDLGGDHYLAGLDLDSCLGEDGALSSWAQTILDGLPSYCEISPSGRGLKVFFFVITDDVRPFLDCIGVGTEQWGARRDVPGFDARKHGPAVEIYFADRYFAVTENRWSASPDALATLDHAALEHLARHIPPARSQTNSKSGSNGGDNSRSAKAFNKGREFCRQHSDCTFEDMAAMLRGDPETAGWCREKGDAVGGRELRNIWEKAKPNDTDAKYTELAALPPDEYDHRRKLAAQELGIRPSTLDEMVKAKRKIISVAAAPQPGRELKLADPEPWPEPVNGPSLLENAVAEIRRYVVLEEYEARAIALWVVACHAFRSFKVFPRLFISAADKSCGKTTSLEVIFHQVPRAMMVSNASAAALFRVIEQARPTLLLDEADSFVKNNEDLRGIIDAGHRFDGNVVRCVETPDGYEPRLFSVWAAMVLAAIGRLPSTIEDRCVKIRLRRRLADEMVETLRIGRTERLEMIAQQAARWTKDNAEGIAAADPVMPKEIVNRQADNWAPLFAVADLIGPRWGQYARDAATKISGRGEASMRELLLTDIQELFNTPLPGLSPVEQFAVGLPAVLFTKEILESLNNKDDRPWPEWGKDRKPMTGPQLASMLKPLQIPTGNAVRRGKEVAKGYRREDLADAFKRYARPPNGQL